MNPRLHRWKKYNLEGARNKLSHLFWRNPSQQKGREEMKNSGLHKFPGVVGEDLDPEIFSKMMTLL